mmetsp:Transcript_108526/g.171274  ORF Transcript_108526/g.171274 Transcript_108526/m.171274 type:complete len:228 (-) Transcript_108526:402-1085(-)
MRLLQTAMPCLQALCRVSSSAVPRLAQVQPREQQELPPKLYSRCQNRCLPQQILRQLMFPFRAAVAKLDKPIQRSAEPATIFSQARERARQLILPAQQTDQQPISLDEAFAPPEISDRWSFQARPGKILWTSLAEPMLLLTFARAQISRCVSQHLQVQSCSPRGIFASPNLQPPKRIVLDMPPIPGLSWRRLRLCFQQSCNALIYLLGDRWRVPLQSLLMVLPSLQM